jgi:hypothetical protein
LTNDEIEIFTSLFIVIVFDNRLHHAAGAKKVNLRPEDEDFTSEKSAFGS